MERLAQRRRVFHSEADFQHAFAWELRLLFPAWEIRLEVPVRAENGAVHLDLLACAAESRVAFELKYKTRSLCLSLEGEDFVLADQAAQDIGRYDFFNDVRRIERYIGIDQKRLGYAIFLTNDSAYWKQPSGLEHGYVRFAMNDGRKVSGPLAWGAKASAGTRFNREREILIAGSYELQWSDYSSLPADRYGSFRYVCLKGQRLLSPEVKIEKKQPKDCTPAELNAFCELVLKGDEVDPDGLEGRVRNAHLLAFGLIDGSLVAVAALKNPHLGYRAGVFAKSKSEVQPDGFDLELGWAMVDERFRRRGHGRTLISALLAAEPTKGVYTTSRATNDGMHALLVAAGFAKMGDPWRSSRGPYDLVLHVKRAP